jgi:cell division protein FtsQ
MPRIRIRINWRAVLLPPLVVGALACVAVVARLALDHPVRELVIEGSFQRVSAMQVEAAAAPLLGGTFLSLDLRELKDRVRALDWVDRVRVSRVWPDAVRIRVSEHRAAASWGEHGLLNERGELFTENAQHDYAELPKLSGPPGSEHDVASLYLAVRGRLADAHLTLDSLSMDARGAVEIVLNTGQHVRLGRTAVRERLDRFFAIAAPALSGDFNHIDYIDLRYTNGFAVGWDEQPDAGLAQVAEASGRG